MENRQTNRQRRRLTAWLVGAALLGAPAPAAAILGDTRDAFGVDGSLRTVNALTDNYQIGGVAIGEDADGSSQTLLRFVIGGYPADWLSYEAHLVQDVSLRTAAGASPLATFGAGTTGATYRAVDGAWIWHDGTRVSARLLIDRLNFKLMLPFADISVGRQAITFGKAYFWNPLDTFMAFDPTAFDRDYKGGVDALRVDVPFGNFSGVTLIGVLGDPADGHADYRSAAIARVFTNFADWDFAVQGGKIHGGMMVGAAASGEAGPVEARIEGSYFTPLDDLRPLFDPELPEALTVVAGVGRLFENSLSLQIEYLYNGAGQLPLADVLPLLASGLVRHASEHVLGGVASYELTALMRGSLAAIVSLSDGSGLIQPGVSYSAADEVDILAGAIIAFGRRPRLVSSRVVGGANDPPPAPSLQLLSEFGSYPSVFYAEIKVYF